MSELDVHLNYLELAPLQSCGGGNRRGGGGEEYHSFCTVNVASGANSSMPGVWVGCSRLFIADYESVQPPLTNLPLNCQIITGMVTMIVPALTLWDTTAG